MASDEIRLKVIPASFSVQTSLICSNSKETMITHYILDHLIRQLANVYTSTSEELAQTASEKPLHLQL